MDFVERYGWLCLGIDGGGTKTQAVATWSFTPEEVAKGSSVTKDSFIEVGDKIERPHELWEDELACYCAVGYGEAGSANPNSVGADQAVDNVMRGASKAIAGALEQVQSIMTSRGGDYEQGKIPLSICLSTSGVDRKGDDVPFVEGFKRMIMEENFKGRFHEDLFVIKVVNDAYAALASGLYMSTPDQAPPLHWLKDEMKGMVLIAGTGTIAYGVKETAKPEGRGIETGRVGGWGCSFGDAGSGYDLGHRLLCAVARCHDGRDGRETVLTKLVLEHLSLQQPEQLIKWAYTEGKEWATMATLAPLVLKGAEEGDAISKEIVDACTTEMAESICALNKKVFSSSDKPPIVLVGGLMQSSMVPQLKEKLSAFSALAECKIIQPTMSAKFGAAALAQKWAGKTS
ncbi:N-acetyl-D-glucosamine kinase [Chloropicon primus]|uniref:N-acetyl-D-glucosamine kinase n=1 Tax=Chloropicon primus TaxID=1764295 RepID=A0A5B8MZA4_9CHLO|nr:N-acetyl-D-glucosamine kinase [Chloropicon primus]|eukprot:QDZ25681.1 N-acetyl-D-glucosamine kinase [Chloropicon primus]